MKKVYIFTLSLIAIVSLVGCQNNTKDTIVTKEIMSNETEDDKSVEEKTTKSFEGNELEVGVANRDELRDSVEKQVDNYIQSLNKEYKDLESNITNYDEYTQNTNKIEEYYLTTYYETSKMCINIREYAVCYAETILSSDTSNDDKYDELEEIYDDLYEDACEAIYDEVYDGILDEIYDLFYDGVLEEKSEDIDYKDWFDARSDEYDWWSDARSDVYDEWSDCRKDVYRFWTDMRSDVFKDDIEKAYEEIEEFKADIEKLKK
ncbi:MAG: hypothetical protein IJC76_01615 [Lachnospiraceae bacterium]|nr:hypothetical protein [Lachnospiraceae bacterium]